MTGVAYSYCESIANNPASVENFLSSFRGDIRRGDDALIPIVTTLVEQLRHLPPGQRRAATYALSLVGTKGDATVLSLLATQLDSAAPYKDELLAVIKALATVADKGNTIAMTAISTQLNHEDTDIRKTAVDALATVAKKGDVFVMASLSKQLKRKHVPADVKRLAIYGLQSVATKGNVAAAIEVSTQLDDLECQIQQVAKKVLPTMVDMGDVAMVAAVIKLLTHDKSRVKLAAIRILSLAAEQDVIDGLIQDRRARLAAIELKNDTDPRVREAAISCRFFN